MRTTIAINGASTDIEFTGQINIRITSDIMLTIAETGDFSRPLSINITKPSVASTPCDTCTQRNTLSCSEDCPGHNF